MSQAVAIAFTIWNRPHYLRQVLEAWSRVRGIDKAILYFSCEPGCEEAVELCRQVTFAPSVIELHPVQLGAVNNVKHAMDTAATFADYIIWGTDDFVPSTDALELHVWHRDNYQHDPSVLALACGRVEAAEGGLNAVWRTQVMHWLPGFHSSKWAMISAEWPDPMLMQWWQWIDVTWCFQRGMDIFLPAISRAQDIGEMGAFPLPYAFSDIQSKCFTPDYPRSQFYEVKGKCQRGFDSHIEFC